MPRCMYMHRGLASFVALTTTISLLMSFADKAAKALTWSRLVTLSSKSRFSLLTGVRAASTPMTSMPSSASVKMMRLRALRCEPVFEL